MRRIKLAIYTNYIIPLVIVVVVCVMVVIVFVQYGLDRRFDIDDFLGSGEIERSFGKDNFGIIGKVRFFGEGDGGRVRGVVFISGEIGRGVFFISGVIGRCFEIERGVMGGLGGKDERGVVGRRGNGEGDRTARFAIGIFTSVVKDGNESTKGGIHSGLNLYLCIIINITYYLIYFFIIYLQRLERLRLRRIFGYIKI